MSKKKEEENKKKIKKQIEKIREVFGMSPEEIKKHPQLKKLQEYVEGTETGTKYAIGCYGKEDCYVVYKPEYDVYSKDVS